MDSSSSSSPSSPAEPGCIDVVFKWQSRQLPVSISPNETILLVKERLYLLTNVLPARQKILGLKLKTGGAGVQPKDETLISELVLKQSQNIMLMGTAEAEIKAVDEMLEGESEETSGDIQLEVENALDLAKDEVNLKKIKDRISKYKIKEFTPPLGAPSSRKLLVLDVDYTLFDHRSSVETPLELMRPFLHEFLALCYQHYDLVIWSATSYHWIERKMGSLGVLTNPNYKISFFLDHGAMITVHSPKYGVQDTKGLGVIWGLYPTLYNEKNTIHIDDLARNFLMNPKNGLKIKPFRQAPLNRTTDRVLKKLAKYLVAIAPVDDLRALNHNEWESYLRRRKRARTSKGEE